MKRLLSLLLSFILLFGLSACGGRLPSPNLGFLKPTNAPEPLPTVRVTFPEGWSVTEISQKLEESGVCPADDFMKLITDKTYIASLEYTVLDGVNDIDGLAFPLEGFIFPDTYEFYKDESAENALSRFLKNTESKITDEMKQRAAELGFTVIEVLTLASVIQEEASVPSEMPAVSSVFHNRLGRADYPKLQSDVTRNYVKNILDLSPYLAERDEDFSLIYDTYECTGLPAGPVCNPGINAINAVLYPEETEYLFFVTDEEGNYYYAETYDEHKKYCNDIGLKG